MQLNSMWIKIIFLLYIKSTYKYDKKYNII